jgi:hypothetical protein
VSCGGHTLFAENVVVATGALTPLMWRVRRSDFAPAGIERVPRVTAVRDGNPENGRILEVSNVIWCTGYTPHYDWIDLPMRTLFKGYF